MCEGGDEGAPRNTPPRPSPQGRDRESSRTLRSFGVVGPTRNRDGLSWPLFYDRFLHLTQDCRPSHDSSHPTVSPRGIFVSVPDTREGPSRPLGPDHCQGFSRTLVCSVLPTGETPLLSDHSPVVRRLDTRVGPRYLGPLGAPRETQVGLARTPKSYGSGSSYCRDPEGGLRES